MKSMDEAREEVRRRSIVVMYSLLEINPPGTIYHDYALRKIKELNKEKNENNN